MDVNRYVEAFFRHKLLVIAPVILALLMSVWYVGSQSKTYQSSTTVWLDTSLPNPSSIDVPAQGATPAQQAQTVLQELISTRAFLVKVGHRGPLAAYLASHRPVGKRGPTAFLSKLTSFLKSGSGAPGPVDDRIASSLSGAFSVTVTGPQVLRVTMTSPTPEPMPGTLTALINEYTDEVTGVRTSRDEATVAYYKGLLDSAQTTLTSADSSLTDYEATHPGATVVNDPVLGHLEQVALTAQSNYVGLQNNFGQAGLALTSAQTAESIHFLDSPTTAWAVSHRKKAIFAGVAGIVIGIIISIFAISALVATDKTARIDEDLDDVEGVEVVANIQHLRHSQGAKRSVEAQEVGR
jgi:uncharacterized protein involved in exopolysaccharide biosynthesis